MVACHWSILFSVCLTLLSCGVINVHGSCQVPGIPSHGHYVSSKLRQNGYFPEGTVVRFSCNAGYELVGSIKIQCEPNKQWTGQAPLCIGVKCPAPVNPEHGHVDYDLSRLHYGSTIRYSCQESLCWELVGPEVRVCQHDKTWSGGIPYCRKNGCGRLGEIHNGNCIYYLPSGSNQGSVHHSCVPFGTKAIFNCKANYKMSEGQSSMRLCLSNDGEWSGRSNPVCEAAVCKHPPTIANGKWEEHKKKSFQVGESLTYKCNSGYYLWGSSERTCSTSGQDSGHSDPFWDLAPPKCLTLTQLSKKCKDQNEVLLWDKFTHTPSCVAHSEPDNASTKPEVGTLTIVTATAGSIFGVLVVLVFVVACQRRRNYYYLRRSARQRRSTDDHCALIAYSGDVHFVLPSYDEAITQEEREPPSFESVTRNLSTIVEETAGSDDTQSSVISPDSPVATADSAPVSNNSEGSENAAENDCTITSNPIYEEIENNSRENSAELSDSEPVLTLDAAGLADMSMWTLLA